MNIYKQAKEDYQTAKKLNLTDLNRWEDGIEHHPMSERLVRFLVEHDVYDYNDYFSWIPMISDAHMTKIYIKDGVINIVEVYPWDYLDFKMIPNKNNN